MDERSREAVRVAEKFIDAGVREYVLHGAFFAAADATSRTPGVHDGYAYFAQMAADASLTLGQLVACFEHIPSSPQGHYEDELGIEGRFKRQSTQVGFIRDIFGNPFRPVPFLPEWRTATTVGIATAIYEERAFDRLPILADAMQDAGCEDADVLAHCRDGGPHVRGCWVVDGVLGKG